MQDLEIEVDDEEALEIDEDLIQADLEAEATAAEDAEPAAAASAAAQVEIQDKRVGFPTQSGILLLLPALEAGLARLHPAKSHATNLGSLLPTACSPVACASSL